MMSMNSTLLSSVKSFLTGIPVQQHPCCGAPSTEPHLPSCHCGTEVSERLFSMKEVSQHCDSQSCWVVVDNAVYDLTNFIYDHPGGLDIMLEHGGTDCTGTFQDVGHSPWAAQLLQKYKIGMLRPEERIFL